jgi:hypothetical protein
MRNRHHSRERRVWLDDRGVLKPVSIVAGLDDGNYVEVVSGTLRTGDKVAVGESRAGSPGGGVATAPSSLRRVRQRSISHVNESSQR